MSALVASLALVLATVAVHVSGLYAVALRCFDIGGRDFSRRGRPFFLRMVLLLTLYIVALHMIEVWIWAAFYRIVVGFDDWSTAVYFSLGCYSTVGTGDVHLPGEWRVLEGLEAILAALMFGLSTAFLFGALSELHRRWREAASKNDVERGFPHRERRDHA